MTEFGRDRLKESLESVLGMIDTLKARLARATTVQERQWSMSSCANWRPTSRK
jgi:hypothetical protein